MNIASAPILAWHFVRTSLRDGRPIPADGAPLIHEDEVIPCRSGLHASVRLIDALEYAPGETLCRVSCTGKVAFEDDKLACSQRTILWRIDAASVLREFARKCALDVAHLWDMPSVVREYLETGRDDLRAAAWDAADSAAGNTAKGAAWDAADSAAWDAARAAAFASAKAPARTAADAAADAAAWAAAWGAARAAARGAAWDAARTAARTTQNARLETMVQMVRAKVEAAAKGRRVSGDC